jgi:hypothetical protein
MVKKTAGTKGRADVTFTIYPQRSTRSAAVFGEWNGWSAGAAMYPCGRGGFSRTIRLAAGDADNSYQFKYLLDGEYWENDPAADRYADGNSVVDLTDPALGNGPVLPGNLKELAAASAGDFTGSAGSRIDFLSKARDLLNEALDGPAPPGVPADLVPAITAVVLDVIDVIDRDLQPADLDTLTDLKQALADRLQASVPAIQARPVPLLRVLLHTGR